MPKPPSGRPSKGLTAEGALARWSEPDVYNELIAIAEASDLPTLQVSWSHIRDATRLKSYRDKREVLENALVRRLRDAEIFASGIAKNATRREVIHPTLWDTLCVSHDFDEIVGSEHFYEYAEFFGTDAIPLNVDPIPDWLGAKIGAVSPDAFQYNNDYSRVELYGLSCRLSPLRAKVVALLHEAWLANEDDPWLNGKKLLEKAGSPQTKIVDVFKSCRNWRTLIHSDRRGMYRIGLEISKKTRR